MVGFRWWPAHSYILLHAPNKSCNNARRPHQRHSERLWNKVSHSYNACHMYHLSEQKLSNQTMLQCVKQNMHCSTSSPSLRDSFRTVTFFPTAGGRPCFIEVLFPLPLILWFKSKYISLIWRTISVFVDRILNSSTLKSDLVAQKFIELFLRSVGKMQSQSGGERRQGSQHRFVPFAQPGPRVI